MKRAIVRLSGTVSCLVAFASGSPAWADSESNVIRACAAVLRPNRVALESNRYAQLAEIRTLQSSTINNSSQNGEIHYVDIVGATVGSSDNRTSLENSYSQLAWSTDDYLGYVAAYVPREAYPAFNQCVADVLSRQGIHFEVVRADARTVTIRLHFVGAPGSRENYRLSMVVTNANGPATYDFQAPASGFDRLITLVKANPMESLTITANVDVGPSLPPGDFVSIPAYMRTRKVVDSRTVEARSRPVACGGGQGGMGDTTAGDDFGPGSAQPNQEYSDVSLAVVDQGSWNDDRYPPRDPHYEFVGNTPRNLIVRPICHPYNGSVQGHFTLLLRYQVRTTRFEDIPPV